MPAPKLSHVHLKVNKLEGMAAFYQEVFDMNVTEDLGAFLFLSNDTAHHRLALQESATGFNPSAQKLYHVAFEVEGESEFFAFAKRLDSLGIECHPVDHGISWALYFADPEGNGLELFLDRRAAPGGSETWAGVSRRLVLPGT
ncbi:MAG: VOC family protein [Armatimonadetes bacterium]|nr:VOC family protein [Armatimonadota bacterium]MBS1711168.1 VOC family protein [Armatimonadota bacterium]MBX3108842.1 VOC family protein [Fimbriimonadaceae bacterium]